MSLFFFLSYQRQLISLFYCASEMWKRYETFSCRSHERQVEVTHPERLSSSRFILAGIKKKVLMHEPHLKVYEKRQRRFPRGFEPSWIYIVRTVGAARVLSAQAKTLSPCLNSDIISRLNIKSKRDLCELVVVKPYSYKAIIIRWCVMRKAQTWNTINGSRF